MKILFYYKNGHEYHAVMTHIDYISKHCDLYIDGNTILDVPLSRVEETVINYFK